MSIYHEFVGQQVAKQAVQHLVMLKCCGFVVGLWLLTYIFVQCVVALL